MGSLSIKCVQRVGLAVHKSVGSYPQLPHTPNAQCGLTKVIHQFTHILRRITPAFPPDFPTGIRHRITDEKRWFSPLSTLPITITITYI